MAGTQDIINETQENAIQGVDASIPSGAAIGSPEEREAVRRAISAKGAWSGMDVARSALMGAGLGAQTQATNPMTAFLQGVTAGLGAPAEVYRAKQDQIKSAVGASPFGAIVEEANNPDNPLYAFRGLPYELVSKAVSGIALESVKIARQGEEERKTEAMKNRITSANAPGYAALYQKATGKPIDPEYLVGINENELKEFIASGGIDTSKVFADESSLRKEFNSQIDKEQFVVSRDNYRNIVDAAKDGTGASDIKLLYSYIKMIDPGSVVREGEVTLTQQGMSIPDRFIVAYKNAVEGQKLSPEFRSELVKQAKDSWGNKTNQFRATVDAYRTLAKNSGFDPNKVVTNIGNVLAYTDPTDSRFIPITAGESPKMERKLGDVFSEVKDGWISTYKVVDVNGKLGRKRISAVPDTEGK